MTRPQRHPLIDDPLFQQLTWNVTPELWELAARFTETLPPAAWPGPVDPEDANGLLAFLKVLHQRRREPRVRRALRVLTEVLDKYPLKSFFRLVLADGRRRNLDARPRWSERLDGGPAVSVTF